MDGASNAANAIHEEPEEYHNIEEPANSYHSAESSWRECNLLSLGILQESPRTIQPY